MGTRQPWQRAADAVGGGGVVDALAALPSSELTALMLEVHARRAAGIAPAEVLRRFERDAFVRPSPVDQRTSALLDAHLLARVPAAFEAVELAPVAPAGACTSVAPVHPNNVLAAARGTEVVADCTNVLALECARRRRAGAPVVRLCTSHRLVRGQRDDRPGHTQHFRVLTLVTAGRDPGGRRFESDALAEHLAAWMDLLASLPAAWRATPREVVVAASEAHARAVERARESVQARHDVPFAPDAERLRASTYYQGIAFKLVVDTRAGVTLPLGDGGLVDWAAKLTADRKERLFISAIGTELLAKLSRVDEGDRPRAALAAR